VAMEVPTVYVASHPNLRL